MENGTIRVTGKGSVKVTPDITRVDITISDVFPSYERAYMTASDNNGEMRRIMELLDLDTSLPKTISFDIQKHFESHKDKYGNWTEEFKGFKLKQLIRIDLGMSTVVLGKLVQTVGQLMKGVEISIGYTVKDPRPAELRMLEKAVKDAKEKAEIMSRAAGKELGEVRSIEYGETSIHIYAQARNIGCAEDAQCCSAESLDITPADLAASDEVTVEWYIK